MKSKFIFHAIAWFFQLERMCILYLIIRLTFVSQITIIDFVVEYTEVIIIIKCVYYFFSNYYKIMDANWYFMYDILVFFSNTQV